MLLTLWQSVFTIFVVWELWPNVVATEINQLALVMDLSEILAHYNWAGSLLALVSVIITVAIGKFILFKVPVLANAKTLNQQEDKIKWKKPKYPPVVKASQKVGLISNLVFFILILPFCITFDVQPFWQVLLDVFVILMFYDFFYYLTHRFLFHGKGKMRLVHAVHHQARTPTWIDAHYVHPVETFIGLALYMGSIVVLTLIMGPFHVATVALTIVIFTQINIINHTSIELDRFPFKTATWITRKHHVHHENMQMGNYATITLFFDKIFGTLD